MTLDPKIKAVGFDMDGTVLDTKVDYEKLGRIIPDEFSTQGVPRELIDKDIEENSASNGLAWLKANRPEAYAQFDHVVGGRATAVEMEFADQARPFPGVIEMIRDLRAGGYRTAILTRGGREYATALLTRFGMMDLFDAVVARDDYPYEEAKPAKEAMEHVCGKIGVGCDEIIYLGDGSADYHTCINSGTRFIGVETHLSRSDWERIGGRSVVTIPQISDFRRYMD